MSILWEIQKHEDLTNLLKKAEKFATEKHKKDVRKSGEPYIVHPRNVAKLVKEYGGDLEQQAAAWLHDVIEDAHVSYEELIEEFNKNIADYVRHLTNPKNLDKSKKSAYIANKLNTMPSKAVTIKLCDRLNNVSDFATAPKHFVKPYKRGTEELLSKLDMNRFNSTQLKIIDAIKSQIEKY